MTSFILFTVCLILNFSALSAFTFDPKAVDVLLREIRARLQEKREIKAESTIGKADLKNEQLLDVEGSGNEDEEDLIEGSGVTGVPLLLDSVDTKALQADAQSSDKFSRPPTLFDKHGNLKSKEEFDKFTYNNLMKQAPKTIQERYELNPTATIQMLKGLDIHGPSGGYHRALSGGYLPPSTYDPYNVNWHSYGERGVKQMDQAIEVFRRVIN